MRPGALSTNRTNLTWVKDRFGYGDWLRTQTEHVLMTTRGRPVVQLTYEFTVLRAPMRTHSEKPDEFYALVERLCPAPRYCGAVRGARGRIGRWDTAMSTLPFSGDELRTTSHETHHRLSRLQAAVEKPLRGFARILVRELHLIINDVALHEKGGSRWAGLPGRPQIRDRAVVTDERGKTAYAAVLEFETYAAGDAFSDAVWRAVEAVASLEEALP